LPYSCLSSFFILLMILSTLSSNILLVIFRYSCMMKRSQLRYKILTNFHICTLIAWSSTDCVEIVRSWTHLTEDCLMIVLHLSKYISYEFRNSLKCIYNVLFCFSSLYLHSWSDALHHSVKLPKHWQYMLLYLWKYKNILIILLLTV